MTAVGSAPRSVVLIHSRISHSLLIISRIHRPAGFYFISVYGGLVCYN